MTGQPTGRALETAAIAAAGLLTVAFLLHGFWPTLYFMMTEKRTVEGVIGIVGSDARARLQPHFAKAGVAYPPARVTLLATKDTAKLEVWAESDQGARLIRTYDIQALSGISGPKLREGDEQVPEGLYHVSALNPNSSYHLSLQLNYPNEFDLAQARRDGRSNPGSNIFIHGKAVSVGCLAMGDEAIEELFVLTHDVGSRVHVAIAPTDPRARPLSSGPGPAWIETLYGEIDREFARFVPGEANRLATNE